MFKNQFEADCKVTLYHKYANTTRYYHQHSKCRSVYEAIRQIKSHDEYVLAQEIKERKHHSECSLQSRRQLKVYETSGYNYKATPTIILKGAWLEAWGFEAGEKVNVICEGEGKISIVRSENDEPPAE